MNNKPTQAEIDAAEDEALEKAIYQQWLGRAVEPSGGPSLAQQYQRHVNQLKEKRK